MAASKRAPARKVTSGNPKSVSKSGSKPPARKSVAGRKPAGRAKVEEHPPRKADVSPVQRKLDTLVAMPSDRYPTVDPTVLASAFGRAAKDDRWATVSWDPTKQQWEVPSATDPRRSYRVWRRRGRKGRLPFYVILECNCQAEQSGSYIVCWHKCAVKMWLDEYFHLKALADEDANE
jgi:hypothetical protein